MPIHQSPIGQVGKVRSVYCMIDMLTHKARNRKADRHSNQLGPNSSTRRLGTRGKVGRVGDQGKHVVEAARDADEHLPRQVAPRQRGRLRKDGTDAASAGDGPAKEGKADDGANDGLDEEEPAELVDGDPDGGEGEEPVDEE